MKQNQSPKPWWREPWTWYLMLGPFVAILACAVTISLALQNFADQPIYDGGVKRGLVVEKPVNSPAGQQP